MTKIRSTMFKVLVMLTLVFSVLIPNSNVEAAEGDKKIKISQTFEGGGFKDVYDREGNLITRKIDYLLIEYNETTGGNGKSYPITIDKDGEGIINDIKPGTYNLYRMMSEGASTIYDLSQPETNVDNVIEIGSLNYKFDIPSSFNDEFLEFSFEYKAKKNGYLTTMTVGNDLPEDLVFGKIKVLSTSINMEEVEVGFPIMNAQPGFGEIYPGYFDAEIDLSSIPDGYKLGSVSVTSFDPITKEVTTQVLTTNVFRAYARPSLSSEQSYFVEVFIPIIKNEPSETTYTVTYDGNGHDGGNVPVDPNQYEENAAVTVLEETMTKTGYIFKGWKYDGELYQKDETVTMPASNITFVAEWEAEPVIPATYTVTYDGNGHDGGNVPVDPNQYEENAAVTVLEETMTKTGYIFKGWKYDGELYQKDETVTIPANNITFVAEWEAISEIPVDPVDPVEPVEPPVKPTTPEVPSTPETPKLPATGIATSQLPLILVGLGFLVFILGNKKSKKRA